jgi:hypothetical protein
MKYFDGLTDIHIQLVSFTGGGDFRASLPGTGLGIKHLSLVRVYGKVASEEKGLPRVDGEFAVHWDWGLFTFMNYGEAKGNQEWRKLCRVSVDDIYDPHPDQSFYEERLGERRSGEPADKDGAGTPPAEEAELRTVAQTVFRALKAGDLSHLETLIPAAEDVQWVADHFRERSGEDVDAQLEKEGGAAGVAAKSREEIEKSFQVARDRSAQDFGWDQATFGGLVADETKIDSEMDLRNGDVTFLVLSGGKSYAFRLNDCGRIGRGWILTQGIDYKGAHR